MHSSEAVVRRMLQVASAEVSSTEPAALRDDPDGVHAHRTRGRRLRALLAVTRRVADPADVRPLRVALAEWGSALGTVRDAEVRAVLAAEVLDYVALDDVDADPDIRRRLVDDERDEHARLHERLVELAAEPRAAQRRQLERECGLRVGLTTDAPADELLARMLRREARRVRTAARGVDGSLDSYHALRKAGRRLRYVAEAIDEAAPGLLGKAPKRLAKAGKRVHAVLGDHRDLLLLADRAASMRVRAERAQEPTGAYDLVEANARAAAAKRLAKTRTAVRRVREAARALA